MMLLRREERIDPARSHGHAATPVACLITQLLEVVSLFSYLKNSH